MFLRIKDILMNPEDVDLIQPHWEDSEIYLELLFRNRKHPIRVCCESEEELDDIFESLTLVLTDVILPARKEQRKARDDDDIELDL